MSPASEPRRATPEDIPALIEIGRRFYAMSPHRPMGPYDDGAVANVLVFLMTNAAGLVMTNEEGVIGGLLAPVYFSPGVRTMDEHFWWAGAGGRDLLRAFEAEAKKMGADYVVLSTLENGRAAAIDRVVTRMDYKPLERRYIKGLMTWQ